jgi:hypothetical protein
MPVSTTMSAINTEVDYSSTAQTGLNDSRVRNLANIASGAISFENCRWGIAVPARFIGGVVLSDNDPAYSFSNTLSASANEQIPFMDPNPNNYNASADVSFLSNGTLRIQVSNSTLGSVNNDYTWLIIGSNSDYTIRFDLTSGSVGGSTTGSDLALTSTRNWFVTVTGEDSATAEGNLILKRSSTTVMTRPVSLSATVSSGP